MKFRDHNQQTFHTDGRTDDIR